jgi:hypothetical protein
MDISKIISAAGETKGGEEYQHGDSYHTHLGSPGIVTSYPFEGIGSGKNLTARTWYERTKEEGDDTSRHAFWDYHLGTENPELFEKMGIVYHKENNNYKPFGKRTLIEKKDCASFWTDAHSFSKNSTKPLKACKVFRGLADYNLDSMGEEKGIAGRCISKLGQTCSKWDTNTTDNTKDPAHQWSLADWLNETPAIQAKTLRRADFPGCCSNSIIDHILFGSAKAGIDAAWGELTSWTADLGIALIFGAGSFGGVNNISSLAIMDPVGCTQVVLDPDVHTNGSLFGPNDVLLEPTDTDHYRTWGVSRGMDSGGKQMFKTPNIPRGQHQKVNMVGKEQNTFGRKATKEAVGVDYIYTRSNRIKAAEKDMNGTAEILMLPSPQENITSLFRCKFLGGNPRDLITNSRSPSSTQPFKYIWYKNQKVVMAPPSIKEDYETKTYNTDLQKLNEYQWTQMLESTGGVPTPFFFRKVNSDGRDIAKSGIGICVWTPGRLIEQRITRGEIDHHTVRLKEGIELQDAESTGPKSKSRVTGVGTSEQHGFRPLNYLRDVMQRIPDQYLCYELKLIFDRGGSSNLRDVAKKEKKADEYLATKKMKKDLEKAKSPDPQKREELQSQLKNLKKKIDDPYGTIQSFDALEGKKPRTWTLSRLQQMFNSETSPLPLVTSSKPATKEEPTEGETKTSKSTTELLSVEELAKKIKKAVKKIRKSESGIDHEKMVDQAKAALETEMGHPIREDRWQEALKILEQKAAAADQRLQELTSMERPNIATFPDEGETKFSHQRPNTSLDEQIALELHQEELER